VRFVDWVYQYKIKLIAFCFSKCLIRSMFINSNDQFKIFISHSPKSKLWPHQKIFLRIKIIVMAEFAWSRRKSSNRLRWKSRIRSPMIIYYFCDQL